MSYDFLVVKRSQKLKLSTEIGSTGASYRGKVTGSYSDPLGLNKGSISQEVSVSVSGSGVKCSVFIPILDERKTFTFG